MSFLKQRDGRTDLTRSAVAALESVEFEKGFLHRMQFVPMTEAFDSRDVIAIVRDGQRQTGINAPTVDEDRASAALPVIAAFFRAGQMEAFAQQIEESDARIQ